MSCSLPALVGQPDQVAYSFPSAPVKTSGSIASSPLDSASLPCAEPVAASA